MGVIKEIQEDLEAGARRLFGEYHSRLLAEARSLCSDSDSAEDLVMLTLETYFAKPEKYDSSKGELMTWLKAVMRNHFRKSLRRKSHIDTIFLPADDLQVVAERLQAGEAQTEPEGTESDELIRRAVASLSPKVRDAVILHYFKGQPVDKTASALGISVEAAKNRLFCARQILHARLKGRLGKSLAVLAVLLFGITALFGAYQLGKVEEVVKVEEVEEMEKVEKGGDCASNRRSPTGILSASEQKDGPSASFLDGPQSPGGGRGEQLEQTQETQSQASQLQEEPMQEREDSMNIRAKITKTVAAAAVAALGFSTRADLPPQYMQCEYIESTGWEYIKTDISPSRSTRFVLDFQMLQATSPRDLRGMVDTPAMGGNSSKTYFTIGAQPSASGDGCVARARCSNVYADYDVYEDVNAFDRTVVDLSGDGTVWVNGKQRRTQTGLNASTDTAYYKTEGLYLFGVAVPDDLATYSVLFPCKARVFGCQFYNGENLSRNFIPCFDRESLTFGLYDSVYGKFYGNASGMGAFAGKGGIVFDVRDFERDDWKNFKYESRLSFRKVGTDKPLLDVPVLVRISESAISGFKYEDCVDGLCIAFAQAPSGTWLDYEIEEWNTNGESLVWVRIPELTKNTRVRMYWGAPNGHCIIPPKPSRDSVWVTGGYSTVLHMDTTQGTDATGGNVFTTTEVNVGEGPVGSCLQSMSRIKSAVGVSSAALQAPWVKALTSKSFTMSFWVYFKTGGSAEWPHMAQWGSNYNSKDAAGFWLGASQSPTAGSYGTAFWFTAHGQICPVYRTLHPELDWDRLNYNNQWLHYAYSYEQLEDGKVHVRVFLNGVPVEEVTEELPNGATSFITAAAQTLALELMPDSDYVRMDEFRLSSVARDADYISAAYRTMAEPDFVKKSAAGKASSPNQGLMLLVY